MGDKVETLGRLAQWKIDNFGLCSYKKSDPFKVGIWNWWVCVCVCLCVFELNEFGLRFSLRTSPGTFQLWGISTSSYIFFRNRLRFLRINHRLLDSFFESPMLAHLAAFIFPLVPILCINIFYVHCLLANLTFSL